MSIKEIRIIGIPGKNKFELVPDSSSWTEKEASRIFANWVGVHANKYKINVDDFEIYTDTNKSRKRFFSPIRPTKIRIYRYVDKYPLDEF
jgi:hypothetical protein